MSHETPHRAAPRATPCLLGRAPGCCGSLLTLALVLAAVGAANARAGEWVQASCVNPDGTAAGSAGWAVMIAGGGYGSNADAACGPGSPAWALLSNEVAVTVGSAETLVYTPPAGSTLQGGHVDVALSADGYGQDASGTAVAYSPEYMYDSSSVFFQCAAGLTACGPGGSDYTGTLALPAGRGGRLYLSAGCGGAPGAVCDVGGSDGALSRVQLYGAALRLASSATPGGTGFAGTLLGGDARGPRELAFTASDPDGPGVYRVELEADGVLLYTGTPDTNGGACVAAGSEAGVLVFDGSQPCRESESVDVALDTTVLEDGPHTLKVSVLDAAQNRSVVYDAAFTTRNAPEPLTAPVAGGAGAAMTLHASSGGWSAPAGAGPVSYAYEWQRCLPDGEDCTAAGVSGASFTAAGSAAAGTVRVLVTASDRDGSTTAASNPVSAIPDLANGAGASEQATLRLSSPRSLRRTHRRSALTLTGQLTAPGGAPIGDATVEIAQQPAGSATAAVTGYARTDADGVFTAAVAAGPSRRMTVGYRAFSADAAYSASASSVETVEGSVGLSVTPRRTRPTGTIELSGRVAGPIPAGGVLVELLVRYRGRWVPFRDPTTGRNGRFRVAYSFQGGEGRFPFRAEVHGGQAGFPYAGGLSRTVTVRTG